MHRLAIRHLNKKPLIKDSSNLSTHHSIKQITTNQPLNDRPNNLNNSNNCSNYKFYSSTPPFCNSPPELPLLQQHIQTISNKGVKFDGRPIYLDSQATTRMDPRVIDIMNKYHIEQWGNPHSSTHLYGWETDDAVEEARKQIARLISSNPKEIIFTSGATESNNLAIKGIALFPRRKEKKHIITMQTEHKCVLDSCRFLETQGFEITYLPVLKNGLCNLQLLTDTIRDDTLLVSCMFVNNEIGVIHPIKQIGQICKDKGVYFHCDAAQALGKIAIDVNELNIDIMSMSGHKIYGPKGIGAIYVRRRPRVQLKPIISGGGQERGLRSGTLAAPLCIGFGKACEIAYECMIEDHKHISYLSNRLYNGIRTELEEIILNGDENNRYEGNLNLSIAFVEGESLIMGLKNVCVSSGSACTSASLEPSYVLRGIGVTEDLAHTSIRFGIDRFTTIEEIDFTIKETVFHVNRLRDMSPLYDLFKEGVLGQIEWAAH